MLTSKINKFLLLFLVFWILLACARTFFNLSKLYTEEKDWYGLTNEEKRGKFFGDPHFFLRYLDSQTSQNSDILFFTNDVKIHYLGRYYLYPLKKLYAENEYFHWDPKKDIYEYIAIYPVSPKLIEHAEKISNIKDFKKIATFKGKNGQVGFIFKK